MRKTMVAAALIVLAVVVLMGRGPNEPGGPSTVSGTRAQLGSGGQHLAITPYPRTTPPAALTDWVGAFDLAIAAGAEANLIAHTWAELEPGAGLYNLKPLTDSLDYTVRRGLQPFICLQVINTTRREVPADLADAAFDDPRMMARFEAFLEALAPHAAGRVAYLSIGNEVEPYLDRNPADWESYKRFYDSAAAAARKMWPGVKVGVTGMFDGLRRGTGKRLRRLQETSDVVILTYYPLDGFEMRAPETVAADFALMLEFAGDRSLLLQEVGYSSSASNASDEQRQAEFHLRAMAEWRKAGTRIPLYNIFLLHDLDTTMCRKLAEYYELAHAPGFEALMCNLGLRRVDGTPKAAWQALFAGLK